MFKCELFQSLEMVFLKLCEEDKEGSPDLTDTNTQVSRLYLSSTTGKIVYLQW